MLFFSILNKLEIYRDTRILEIFLYKIPHKDFLREPNCSMYKDKRSNESYEYSPFAASRTYLKLDKM